MKKLYKKFLKSLLLFILLFSFPSLKAQTGAALNFDGNDDYIQMSSMSFGSSWTAEAWIRPTNLFGNWNVVLGQCYYNGNQGFVIAVQSGSVFVDGPTLGGSIAVGVTSAWTHVAVTYNNGICAFYKNGILVGTRAASFTNSSNPFYLGIRTNNNNVGLVDPYQGDMDEVRIWNVARTQCEIQEYMGCEIPSTATGLVANYHFNQGIAGSISNYLVGPFTLTDNTGNGNTGSLNNFDLNLSSNSNWIGTGSPASGLTAASSASGAEIDVQGNGVSIVDGSTSSSASNNTDFGTALTRTFTIYNTGTTTLNVANPVITGPDASQFSITVQPSAFLATLTGSTTFVVAFTPTSTGVKTATLNIYNSECSSEEIYDFVITATPVPASALNLDGTGDHVTIPDQNFGTGDFTIETWIKPSSINGGYILTSRNFEQGPGGYWWSFGNGGGAIGVELADAQVVNSYTSFSTPTTAIVTGVWSHVAFVRSGLQINLYVNGILSARCTDSFVRNFTKTSNYLDLGEWSYDGAADYSGSIDELRIWSTARTQCEIQTYMNCEIPGTMTNLIGNYHFNQGLPNQANLAVTTLTDASASAMNGTLNGFALTGSTSNWVSPGSVTTGSTTINTPTVEIDVRGNGNSIVDGNTSLSPIDFTDFNGVLTRTFTVHNTISGGTLNLYTPYITGTNANQFTITSLASNSIVGIGSTYFVVQFIPTSVGVKNATINLPNNDCNESVYDFAITATAVAGAAMSFDGVNDNASVASGISIYNQSFSIEFWAQRRTNGVNGIVVGLGSTIATNQALQIGFRNSDQFTFAFYMNDMNYLGPQTTDGNFHHWACVYDAAGVNKNRFLYCDGLLVLSDFSNSAFLGTGAVVIGDAGYGSNPFNGTVDEVRLWNKALSQCEIQSRMNCEIAGSQPSLTVNYHFNQGIAGGTNTTVISLTDDNSSPRNANLSNFSMTGLTSNFVTPGAVTSGYTVQTPPAATLAFVGNGNPINAGSTTPLLSNFTDFGTATTRTLVLQNTGTGSLYINTGYFTGANASNFSVTTIPSTLILNGSPSNVVIKFTPTALGTQSAVLNVVSSDCAHPVYSFVLTASTSPADALEFDGASDYVQIPSVPSMSFGTSTDLTVEAMVQFTANLNGFIGIVDKGDASGSWRGYQLAIVQNKIGAEFATSTGTVGTAKGLLGSTLLNDGLWHHLALTVSRSANTAKLYVDGKLEANVTDPGISGDVNSSQDTYIGVERASVGWMDGKIDEVRIWNTVRSQCEIQSYMACEIPGTATNLLANYHFNQGIPSGPNSAVTTLTDAAGSNDGTLNTFALTGSISNWVSPGGVVSGSIIPAIPTASILVSGNSVSITSGATTTTTLNLTNFGLTTTSTFVIQNSATGTLNIGTPYFTGLNASEFSVSVLPSQSLSASATTSFIVVFTPTAGGFRTATLNIDNNDCNIPIFNCAIGGTPTPASALNFDGINDYVNIAHTSSLNAFPLTVETWVKTSYTGNVATSLVGKYLTSSDNGWLIYLVNGNIFGHYFKDPGNYINPITSTTSIADNNWHHVAMVVDANGGRLYIDGTLSAPNAPWAGTPSPPTTTQDVLIGSYDTYLPGSIDEVRIWNTSRTQCEIQSYMNCEIPTSATGLMANYHFNQGAAALSNSTESVLIDAAGTNTGTLNTFSLIGTGSNWINPGGVISGSITPAVPTASILISGNSTSITPGSTSASTLNFTDFGSLASRTFVIQNAGTGILNIGTPIISGANASQFSLSTLPSETLSSSSTTSFVVVFTPTSLGVNNATIQISSNDCSTGNFSFVITATAVAGSALSFDGIDDYVDLGNSSLLKPSAALTAETWVYSASWPSLDRTILGNTENAGYGIFTSATGDLQGLVRRNSAWGIVTTPLSGVSAGWHHVAMTYDGRYTKLYLDGVLKSTDDATASYTVDYINNNTLLAGEASSGSSPVPGWFFNGKLDEVRIWNRALCMAEIQNNMTCEISTTGNGLVGSYHFNEGIAFGSNSSVITLPDFSGNSLDGTLEDMSRTGTVSNWITPGAVTSGSSCSAFVSAEIDITGNNISIPDGALTPTTSNNTDFGSVCSNSVIVKTFTIQNTGGLALTISTMSLSGAGATSFTTSALSPASPIATNSFAVFSVSFAPTALGVQSATLTIPNNDCDESSYHFAITGTSNAIPSVTASVSNSVICNGTAISLTATGADTYTWNPSVANPTSFTPSATQTYTLSGTYTLTGCTNTNLATQGVTVNPIPAMAISAANATICSGNTATLTASGAGTGGTYTWNPGPVINGTLTVNPNSSTTYSLAGTSTAGCTSTLSATQLITVNTTPTISATSTNTAICNTFSATLSVNGAVTYSWQPASLSGGTITVSPSSTTSYTALGYGSTGCVSSNSIVLTVTVNSLPVVTATASNPVICNSGTTSLIGGGADTYTWSPVAVNNQSFTPPIGTTVYTVVGTNTLTGCTSTNLAVQSITVDLVPAVSATTGNSVICNGNSAILIASGASTYTWNPGNAAGASFTVSPSVFTSYTVVGTSSAGCTSTNLAIQSISVNALPTVSATISSSVICNGTSVTVNGLGASTYTWNNGVSDGVAFTPSLSGTYSVAGTNSAGCTSTNIATVSLTVNALPSLSITVTNPVICIGKQTTLSGNGALTYTWSNGIPDNVAFSPTITTTYSLSGTDVNSCSNTAVQTVTVNNLPVLNVAASSSVSCEAQSTTLTASGAASYTWSTNETLSAIVITPTITSSFTLMATDVNSCTNTLVYTQSVTPCPGVFTASTTFTNVTCNGKNDGIIVVTASTSYTNPIITYNWHPNLCANNSCDTLKHLPAGTYSLTVKITYTVNGTLVKTDSLVLNPITLIDLADQCAVKIFNGITMNGDGVNDVLTIDNIEEFPKNTVIVYNRWGAEVFKVNGYNNLDKAFPPKDLESRLPANTYFYVIDLGNGSKVIKGWIELSKN